jgi:NitT/TauT family transport system permease protein
MTLLRLAVALSVAAATGLAAGVAAGLLPPFYRFIRPVVTVLRTVPVISIVVIILMLFGFSSTPYVITFLMVFPIMFQGAADGIGRIDPELVDVYRLEDNTLVGGLRHCYLPLIRADIRTALLQGAGLGVKVLVMAEYLAQTPHSIGNSLYLARVNLDFASVFAWTALLVIVAAGIEALVRRHGDRRGTVGSRAPRSAVD